MGPSCTYQFGGITGKMTLTQALKDQNGHHTNLVLDAQTYSGGVLELASALQTTGYVQVYGNREWDPGMGGDITLKLNEKDSLAGVENVCLASGGILDINGTQQTIYNIYAFEGSSIIDSSREKTVLYLLNRI